jgi:hypothetical protein
MRSATEWPSGVRHCLRVGSLSDKRVIDESADHFDVLVIQGNLAVSASQGLATWPLDKPVWIDPITYAFAASPVHLQSKNKKGERSYKKTFKSLADAFGQPYQAAIAENRRLSPSDFAAGAAESVERVLAWQEGVFAPLEEDQKYGAEPISPALLTVPFFPLLVSDLSDTAKPSWLDVNLELAGLAASMRDPSRLAVGFLASLDVFDHSRFPIWLEAYADRLSSLGIQHLWWWVSDHDEVTTSLQRATRLIDSIESLSAREIHVHQAFGGSLSSLALLRGLSSVSHGVNYWEQKGWEPIATGGLPSARYFHPGLRERLRVPEAIAVVEHLVEDAPEFYEAVCSCATCRNVVEDDLARFGAFGAVNIKTRRTRGGGTAEFDSPTPEALYRTKMHFLEAKHTEIKAVLTDGFSPSQALRADAEFWASDLTRTGHLERWALALDIAP